MKKLISALLIFCTLLSIVACNKGDENKKPAKPANIIAFATHSYDKYIANIKPKGDFSTDYTVYMLKGETEGCQLAIYSDQAVKKVEFVTVSGENEHLTTEIFSMDRTHAIKRKAYLDSTMPYGKKDVALEKSKVLPFIVEFKTTADTPAGEYKYVFSINDASGKKSVPMATYTVTVHVWDIVLPEEKTFATAGGLGHGWVSHFKGTYKDWYETALQHNISSYDIPVDILSDEADAYLNDPRMTSFQMPIPKNEDKSINEEKLLQYYEKIKSNPVWLSKAYFYPIDEPREVEHLQELRQWEETLGRLCPGIDVCAPFYTNIQLGDNKDQTEDMMDYTTLWCPKLCLWDDSQSYDKYLSYKPEKTFHERMDEQIAEGDRMWSYVCNAPDDPYAQMFIDTEGANQRLMFWQFWQRDIDGFLYWSINYYGYKEGPNAFDQGIKNPTMQNPWKTVNTKIPSDKGTIYGCGFLFYPGQDVGYGGAVPSIRAKIVRDGCDDIELLNLAEQYLGKEWLLEKTYKATPSLTEFVDADKFAAFRIEIGNALEAALKNQ